MNNSGKFSNEDDIPLIKTFISWIKKAKEMKFYLDSKKHYELTAGEYAGVFELCFSSASSDHSKICSSYQITGS